MRIGIDASRAVAQFPTGTENYSRQLISRLLALKGEDTTQFVLYFNAPPTPHLLGTRDGYQARVIPFPRLWTHLRLSWEIALHPPDILFVPAHVLPIIHPLRSVVTIHDLGYLHHPHAYHPTQRPYLTISTLYNARVARHIIADSESTRGDVMRRIGVSPTKITVVYPGVDEEFQSVTNQDAISQVKAKYGIEGEYLLYVGTLHPRKNLERLLEAYIKLRRENNLGLQMVLAGKVGWLPPSLGRWLGEKGVVVTGFIPRKELPALMSGAVVLIMPSLFEGFGFPALEAMACGTPVIASRVGSLPEVVGEAGVLVDPLMVENIAQGIARVVRDENLRAYMREKGLARARTFTWERAARLVLSILLKVGKEA
ncbi:MAG: glycosyltransferase family 4 protein [Chloroflexi bacterium]|nr:glycosyltransferase family 4 protein [Chloroflexota bacterium]